MGYSIAEAAIDMGAKVTLVSGPTHLDAPSAAKLINVETASEMLNAVMETIKNQDIFISVAAVADYRPAKRSLEKIKKSHTALSVELIPNEDILGKVAALSNAPFCVGFACRK
jgi:phosphopantothenoylcysteine decarboxylase/phosphopantothenate--cysteine ligase